jgi:hypothetical protein
MRVIRTEMYLGERATISLDRRSPYPPTISVAWTTTEGRRPQDPRLFSLYQREDFATARPWRARRFFELRNEEPIQVAPYFVETLLRNLPRPRTLEALYRVEIRDPAVIEYVLRQPIVVEQSPPEWLTLLSLLKDASPALLISTYFVGLRGSSLLLIARIGAALILLSSAQGISKWLSDGDFLGFLAHMFQG